MYDVIGMFGTKEQVAKRDAFEKEWKLSMVHRGELVDWTTVRGWPKNLYIDAKTWNENHLVGKIPKPIELKGGAKIYERILPAEEPLELKLRGDRWIGYAAFNAAIVVPILEVHGRAMMGITPFECISQWTGISRAKGHVVMAGLGLGWSLMKIHARKQVRQITVIEKDPEILKRVRKLLGLNDTIPKPIDWICGDMWDIAPKLEADLLFADVWPSYSDVSYERERLVKTCPNIKSVWCWGIGGIRGSMRDR